MFRPLLPTLALIAISASLSSCSSSRAAGNGSQSGDAQAVALLKKAMDRYANLPTYKTRCTESQKTMGMDGPAQSRDIIYEKPNRFRVVSAGVAMVQTCISDGKSEIEFDNLTGQAPRESPAPASIAEASSMQMVHPMFCGTLLYKFFGGAGNFENLVDTAKKPVTLGGEEKAPSGEQARVVKFYGTAQYGNVEVLIGEKSLTVYRIRYDSEPLFKMLSDPATLKQLSGLADVAASQHKKGDGPDVKGFTEAMKSVKMPENMKMDTEELYSQIQIPATIPAATFKVEAPKGTTPVKVPAAPSLSSKPPFPIGSSVPDFTVTSLDGQTVRLSSFRGHPVMIDFWATWCPPCVASLPNTQEIFKNGSPQGLQVMAISDEEQATVSAFIKDKGYTFPTYIDAAKETGAKYKTEAIPTTVVIDADGKLVAYIVGGMQEANIKKALSKVGLKL